MKKYILTTVLSVLFITPLFAQTDFTWTNGNGSNDWSDDGNWHAGAAPSNSDDVVFDGNYSNDDCTLDGLGAEAYSITIQNGYSGIITLTNNTSLSVGDGGITIAASGFSGKIEIETDNSITTPFFSVANNVANNSMTLTVAGSLYTGNFQMPRGTANAGSAQNFEVDASAYGGSSGGFNIASCTFTAPSGELLINVVGSGTLSGLSSGSFNANGGTVKVYFAANKNLPSGYTGTNGFNNLTITLNAITNRIITIPANIDVKGNLVLVSSSTNYLHFGGSGTNLNLYKNLDLTDFNATGGSGSSQATSPNINLVGNTQQKIIGNSDLTKEGGLLPTLVINQASGGTIQFEKRVNLGRSLKIESNGSITCTSNSVIGFLSGFSNETISGATTLTNLDLKDLIINKSGKSVSLSSFTPNIRISGVMTIPAGTYNTNNQLIFRSTSNSASGQLGEVAGTLSGNATVERFIAGATGRKWRFLASPITTSNNISNNWQQQMHITGAGTGGNCASDTKNSNGFDASTTNSASMYTYNEGTGAWAAIANTTSTNLASKTGYRVFVRGARSQGCTLLGATPPSPNNVTLSASGSLLTGTQTINVTKGTGSGWNLVGNPFQAIIDWDNISRTNVAATYYTFNPNAGVSGNGAYGTYTASGSGTNNVTRYIGPGQAFWVEATAATGSIQIEEADKDVTQTSAATTLFKADSSKGVSIKVLDVADHSDEIILDFASNATFCFDNIDAQKFQFASNGGNIASYNSACPTIRYAVNNIPSLNINRIDTVYLHLKLPTNTSANYRLTFDRLLNVDAQYDVFLTDAFTNNLYNLRTSPVYNFSTIANNAATQGANRFSIIIGKNLNPLPVKLVNFTAAKEKNTTRLTWNTTTEINSKLFIIERSTDGTDFSEIGVVSAKGNSTVKVAYQFSDLNPKMGENNFYRLKSVDRDGKFEYSIIQIVSFENDVEKNTEIATNLYPVPANDFVELSINSNVSGAIDYEIYDITGQLVAEAVNMETGDNNELKVNLNPNLKSGVYFIVLMDEFGNSQRLKFIKK